MIRQLTAKEKVATLNSTPLQNMDDINEYITSGFVEEDAERNRISVRVDFRQRVLKWLEENKISQRQLAIRVGILPQAMNAYLKDRQVIPYRVMEELMWLMEEGNMITEEEEKATIIKQ